MKYIERVVLTLLGLAMLFALHQVIGATVAAHKWKGLSSSDWAAWVQAVGSIAAILGAFAIAAKQQRETIQRDRDATAKRIAERQKAVAIVVDNCFSVIYGLPSRGSGYEGYVKHMRTVPQSIFSNLRERLREAPIYEIPNEEIVTCTLLMMESMDKTIDLISKFDTLSASDRGTGWHWLGREIEERRREAWVTKQRLKKALGSPVE